MTNGGLDTTGHIESVCMVAVEAGVLILLLPGVAVGVIIDHHCVADSVDVWC
jgi:hypothetical protein